jgi:KUP system potassium uptake protein
MSEPATATEPAAQSHAPHARTPALLLGAIGVVFGDIGTSPLYTMQECLGEHGVGTDVPSVRGVVSLICWSVTLVVTVKYLAFLTRADNNGEGGIMALLALVPEKLRSPKVGRIGLVALLVIIGAALLFGDGIITPAISVLSAIEGLGVATHFFDKMIVPITVAILFLLFLVQRRGTGGLGRFFGPVMVVWFVTIGTLGAWQVIKNPSILGALNPVDGAMFFVEHKWKGFRVLGGVVLAVTGGEALYADMGHFGRKPIRLAWMALVYPSLLLCYLGQAANLIAHPSAIEQPFYALVPEGRWIYAMVILAAAATVIASQALISGVFSLTHQAIRLGYFPRVEVRHTSGESEGQIYVPLLNWGLAAAAIALVVHFEKSSKLAAAFGLAVSGTMLITSLVYGVVMRQHFKWSPARALAVVIFFLSFDIPFVVANAMKFFEGGYLPFCVGALFVVIMVVWRRGRSLVVDHFRRAAVPTAKFLAEIADRSIGKIHGTAAFLSPHDDDIPPTLQQVVQRFHTIYEHNLLVSVKTAGEPTVPREKRVAIHEVAPSLRRVILHFGFMERPDIPTALADALPRFSCPTAPSHLVYLIGHETFAQTERGAMGPIEEGIFSFLSKNARRATDEFAIPPEQVVELGGQIDL